MEQKLRAKRIRHIGVRPLRKTCQETAVCSQLDRQQGHSGYLAENAQIRLEVLALSTTWEYDPPPTNAAWMGGNSTLNGDHLVSACRHVGTPAPENIPQGAPASVGWTDAKGNLGSWRVNYGSGQKYSMTSGSSNPSTNECGMDESGSKRGV